MSPAPRNKGLLRLSLFALLLLAVCSGVSLLTVTCVKQSQWRQHDGPQGHAWLQKELGLTAEQTAAIDKFLPQYHSQRQQLQAEFDQRTAELAQILAGSSTYTDEVTHAVHRIHIVHGQLQELAIRHYFDMLSVLPPEQQNSLRNLAGEALSRPR